MKNTFHFHRLRILKPGNVTEFNMNVLVKTVKQVKEKRLLPAFYLQSKNNQEQYHTYDDILISWFRKKKSISKKILLLRMLAFQISCGTEDIHLIQSSFVTLSPYLDSGSNAKKYYTQLFPIHTFVPF